MIEKIHCPECDEDRTVDVMDFLYTKAKRVRCGHCDSILLTEDEVMEWFCWGDGGPW